MNKGIGLWRGELSGRGIMLRCRSRNELVSARVKAHLRPIIKKREPPKRLPCKSEVAAYAAPEGFFGYAVF